MIVVFDVFFGVVLCIVIDGYGNSYEEIVDDYIEQYGINSGQSLFLVCEGIDCEVKYNWRKDWQKRWDNYFVDCGFGQDINSVAVIWFCFEFYDVWDFFELMVNFCDNCSCCVIYCYYGYVIEQVRQKIIKEQVDNYVWIFQ